MTLDFPLFPARASTLAAQVDHIYFFLLSVAAFFSLLIAVSILYCAIRYRRRDPDEVGSTFEKSLVLEITWSVVPLIIVLFTFFWGAKIYFAQARPPSDAIEFYGIGKQWMWKFQHPEGNREINTLHVPVGEPIKVTLTSQDVIHSLYIPAFRVKTDVLPGRYTTLWFQATRPGTYHLFCAEYCGTEHSKMTGQVIVQEAEEYEKWLAGGAAGAAKPPVEAGKELFASVGCNTCHKLEGPGGRGPNLVGVFGHEVQLASGETIVADETYLRRSILDPTADIVAGFQPIMPTYKGQLSEEDLLKLILYVKSLGRGGGSFAPAPAAGGGSS